MPFENKKYQALIAASALSVMLGTAASAASASSEQQWTRTYAEADSKIAEQKFGEAEQLLRKTLTLMPTDKSHEEIRSKIYLRLANTLTLNDQTGEAQSYYQKLLDLEEHHHGSDSAHIVPALLALGSIQEAEGNHTTAMQYYKRALQINERNYGPYSPAVADNLQKLGRVNWRAGNRSESSSHYRRSIGILLQQPGLDASNDLLSVMNDYGDKIKGNDNSNKDLLADFKKDILQNKFEGAEPSSTVTKASRGKKSSKEKFSTADIIASGKGSNTVSTTQTNSSTFNRTSNAGSATQTSSTNYNSSSTSSIPSTANISLPRIQPDGAVSPAVQPSVPSFSEQDKIRLNAIKDQQTNMDPDITLKGMSRPLSSATLSPAYKIMNSSLDRQSRYSQSSANLEKSIAADIDALGPNHPTVANDLTNLAQVRIAEGKYSEARGLLYKALPIYEKVYGVNNALTINALSSLALVESQTGNAELALTLYKKALASGQSVLGPNSLETARILNEMAHLYYSQGKLQEARTYYEWAVASTQAAVGDHDTLLAACLKDYAQVLRTMGKDSEASAAEMRASKIASATTP